MFCFSRTPLSVLDPLVENSMREINCLNDRAMSAFRWVAALRFLGQVFSWLSTIFVIRFLAPEDYGVMSLAEVFRTFLVLFSNFLYVLVYTPMKRVSALNTPVGAIPGAIPPLAGWTAATGQADVGGLILFAILFIWQHPHFFAIAWMYKDDYKKAGYHMVTLNDPDGQKTALFTVFGTILMINVSVLPVIFGISSMVYLVAALVAGGAMLATSWLMARSRTYENARRVLKASVVYLPLLLFITIIDKLV